MIAELKYRPEMERYGVLMKHVFVCESLKMMRGAEKGSADMRKTISWK
jgi:hypothetical protein